MSYEPLIQENINKRKFIIIKKLDLTLVDLLALILITMPGIIITCLFYKDSKIAFVATVAFGTFALFLNSHSSKYKTKKYILFIKWFINLFVNKKYTYNDKKYDTKNLIPYQKIEDNFIFLKSGMYLSFVKVKGNNFINLETEKQEVVLEGLWNAYKNLKYGGSIIKLQEFKNYKEQILFLQNKINFWEEQKRANKISEKQYFSRIFVLNKKIDDFKYLGLSKNENNIENNFYIAFYEKSIENIIKQENNLIDNLNKISLKPIKLNSIDKVNILNKLINLEMIDESENDILSYKDKLDDFLSYDKINFKSVLSEITAGDYKWYRSVQGINSYPFRPNLCFLRDICAIERNIVFNFQKVTQEIYEKELARAQNNAIAEAASVSKKEVLTLRKKEIEVQNLESFADAIGYGGDELYRFNLYIIHDEINKSNLRKSIISTNNFLRSMNMRNEYYIYNQFEATSGFMPKPYDPLMQWYGLNVPLFTIAYANPFIDNNLFDEEGYFIGHEKNTNSEIYFNPHIRTNERKNSNMFFVASSGAGKSTAMQKMLINEVMDGTKIYLIDPEGEYKNFARYFGENVIDLCSDLYKINPLQIMPNLNDITDIDDEIWIEKDKQFWLKDDEKDNNYSINIDINKKLVIEQLNLFEVFITNFVSDINQEEMRYIKNKLFDFYINWIEQQGNKDILTWKNTQFPILQDFYIYLINQQKEKYENIVYLNKYISIFESNFINFVDVSNKEKHGSYSMYYNGYTSIDFKNSYMTVFDVSTLYQQTDKKLAKMQMFLILKFIEKQVKINWQNNPKNRQRVVVDEAHILIDQEKPLELNFIYKIVKMIRKRNGGITIITQNPEDFVATPEIEKKTKAIINNSQYALIMELTNESFLKIEEMFADSDGFTEAERQAITKSSDKGDGLLVVGKNNNRYQLSFFVDDFDFNIINNNDKKLLTYTEEQIAIRLFNMIGGIKNIDTDYLNEANSNSEEEISEVIDEKILVKRNNTLHISIKNQNEININIFKNNIELEEIFIKEGVNEARLFMVFNQNHNKALMHFYQKIKNKIIAKTLFKTSLKDSE